MRFRWIIVILSLLVSANLLFRGDEGWNYSFENIRQNVSLGLDLKGGITMTLEVDTEDALHQHLEEMAGAMKNAMEQEGFTVTSSEPLNESDSVRLVGITHPEGKNAEDTLDQFYGRGWFVNMDGNAATLRLKELNKTTVLDGAVDQTVYKIQNRVDQLGVSEPVINRALGSNRIYLELAGTDDSERVHNLVKEPGKLEWRLVQPGTQPAATEAELLRPYGGTPPPGTRVFPHADSGQVMLLQEVILTARNVMNVQPTTDDRGLPAVAVTLDRTGGQIFSRVTGQNVKELLAIVLDGKVISAPQIQSQLSQNFSITGQFSPRDAENLVVKIKSGSLPAEVRVLDESVIGPTLGRDSIRQGTTAAIGGLILVCIFILLYYKLAGIFALFALVLNLIIIMGMMAGLEAVLTLPGIAGFILTIGMAVDANVLVFERIREELRAGTAPRTAVDIGYKSAFVTIMDANVTTFIAAFCLLLMGQGPIKGFAVMLMIGIVCSIFTAVFCSRTFFLTWLRTRGTLKSLPVWPVWRGNPVEKANA